MTNTNARRFQQRITTALESTQHDNIPPSGDTIVQRMETDTYLRFAFQNINGISSHEHTSSEIEAMQQIGIDIMGMSETNRPWTVKTKAEYDLTMSSVFGASRTIYTSAPGLVPHAYQPGGNLLTINGRTTGRVESTGSDSWGRYCWARLRGKRDEGILMICAYRVCHEQSHNPGPLTVYQQQYTLMREAGITQPNPRKQILSDLSKLISTHRADGYRPILMMDANGDYLSPSSPDKDLQAFLLDTHLVDPFHTKFGVSPRTFAYGTKRIDYIFMDSTCTAAIQRVGYLGSHEGAHSDHCLAYVDIDEKLLFHGILNRPVPHHSREITLVQEDKVMRFITELEEKMKEHKLHTRTFDIADKFVTHGPSHSNITTYHRVYGEFLDLAKSVSKKVGRKKFGYMRSSELTLKAQTLLIFKDMLDCKSRRAPLSPALIRRCEKMNICPSIFDTHSVATLRREVRSHRQSLWTCQKNCEDLRREWLISIAKDRARITEDNNWESKLKRMITTAKDRAMNRKLTMVTKGPRGALDRIQIPSHDWFFSPKHDELYHYDKGVFEAYPSCGDSRFFLHHTLKVLPTDAQLVVVEKDEHTQRWIITDTLPPPESFWIDITSQEEIESHLLERNKRHLEQTSREEGTSTAPIMEDLRQNHGINPLTSDLLDGTFDTSLELTPPMAAFFSALRKPDSDTPIRPILGSINSEEFQQMFKSAREQTSSDTRTLNYSLWKCIARSDFISSFASVLLSVPFTYGFANDYWTHMSDFMLEKKPGVRHIHTLRIIGKVAAEFNTCLKFFIGRKAMHNFEDSNPHDSQHGFRPNRSSVDAAMLKLLTFESARLQRSTVGMIQHDMAAHFDRMYPEMANIYAQRYNVDNGILTSIGATIRKLKRNIETAMGLSSDTYSQQEDEPNIGGMVQGKADVPQLSTQQSDILLRAHQSLTTGLTLHNPTGNRKISHHSVSFADDTDQHTNMHSSVPTAIPQVIENLQHSAQTWNDIIAIPGGLLAYHKCNWQLIAWRQENGYMTLIADQEQDHTLRIQDGKGAAAIIDYLPPDKPNIGLGFWLCPNGSQVPHFEQVYHDINLLCQRASTAHLTESETRRLLNQRIIPKLTYALHLSSFSRERCHSIDSLLRRTILPRIRLNRNFPAAVLHGPIELGGLEFPCVYTLQLATQTRYVLKQLRWNKTVANDILVTLDTLQLVTGLQRPLMEYPSPMVEYVGDSFFLHLRSALGQIGASLWIENLWTPHPQRINDTFLMNRFLMIPRITKSALRQANEVRLFLRVLTIADLADPTGRFIPDGMLTGEWQAGSDIHWPHQTKPPPRFWATFRRCLRLAYCTSTNPHQPTNNGMDLDSPLGLWHPVPRHTWFDVYQGEEYVYCRNDSKFIRMKKTAYPGFFVRDSVVDTLPLNTHPTTYTKIGSSIRTYRRYGISHPEEAPFYPAGHVVEDTLLLSNPNYLLIGSDASVHMEKEVTTCAWMISHTDTEFIKACAHITNISSLSSYRGELEGIYRALRHMLQRNLSPELIDFGCDNKAAIDNLNTSYRTPAMMLQPEADIILATHALTAGLPHTLVKFSHIYGHQDTRGVTAPPQLESPSSVSVVSMDFERDFDEPTQLCSPRLSKAARVNIICDELAANTALLVDNTNSTADSLRTLQPPLPFSRAMLKIGDTWITSDLDRHIRIAAHSTPLQVYCRDKYGWSLNTQRIIHWKALASARSKQTHTAQIRTSKILHGWMPVMHMHGHATGCTHCPGCDQEDETFEHMLRCQHPTMTAIRGTFDATLQALGRRINIPSLFLRSFGQYMTAALRGQQVVTSSTTFARKMYHTQNQIGSNMFIRGYLSTSWMEALQRLRIPHPIRMMTKLIRFLWDDVINPLWVTRNNILHKQENSISGLTHTQLGDRMLWYLQHKDELSQHDQFLARFTTLEVEKMTTRIRMEWIRHLDTARNAWIKERAIRSTGQRLMMDYFKRRDSNG